MPRPRIARLARVAALLLPLWQVGLVEPAIAQRATRSRGSGSPAPRTARSGAKATRAPARPARVAAVAALRHTTPRGLDALRSDLGALLSSRTRHGTWGVMVTSVTRGDTLFRQSPDSALVPASTMKLFTSALALERLGAEHLFRTEVLRHGTVDATGTLRGDLVLRGDGDPSMSTRFMRGGPSAPMDLLARQTADAGIRRITGDLIADATAFESRRIPEGWLSRYAGAGYAAPFSALSLNENLVIVGVSPGG
ncbi:MAG: D-alanyl-D-alanine carboxypeptidase, partial [Gemmatimonas sp.]